MNFQRIRGEQKELLSKRKHFHDIYFFFFIYHFRGAMYPWFWFEDSFRNSVAHTVSTHILKFHSHHCNWHCFTCKKNSRCANWKFSHNMLQIVIGNSSWEFIPIFPLFCVLLMYWAQHCLRHLYFFSKILALVIGFFTENMDYCVQSRPGYLPGANEVQTVWAWD